MSGIISGVGDILSGNAQAGADQYNAQVAQAQSRIVTQQGQAQAMLDQQKVERERGTIAAAYGASGVTAQGTPLQVMSDQLTMGQLTKATDLYKSQLAAMGYADQASLDKFNAANAQTAGFLKAGNTILTGQTGVGSADSWIQSNGPMSW